MLFNEEINENEIKDLSMVNFLNITNKAYMLYLNQQIEDFDLDMEQAAFIVELDKNKNISTKDLAEYLFMNGRQSAKTLMALYSRGIIDKKINKDTNDTDNDIDSNDGFDLEDEMNKNQDVEIKLTSYGEKLSSKIKKIDEEWENLIYKNLESSDKDEILDNMKDLAITSIKTNKNENISSDEAKISKTKKMMSKMLNRMLSTDFHGKNAKCGDKFHDKRRRFHGMMDRNHHDSIDPFMFEAHFRGRGFPHRRGPFFR